MVIDYNNFANIQEHYTTMLYKTLTLVGWSIWAPRLRRIFTTLSLPLRLAAYNGDCVPC